ncbi:hypothetical protein ACHWQZ_G014301 [Mnemiopsis leidyi]
MSALITSSNHDRATPLHLLATATNFISGRSASNSGRSTPISGTGAGGLNTAGFVPLPRNSSRLNLSREIIHRSVEKNLPSSLKSEPVDVFEFTDFEVENRLRRTAHKPESNGVGSRSRRINPIPASGQRNSHKLKIKLKYKRI